MLAFQPFSPISLVIIAVVIVVLTRKSRRQQCETDAAWQQYNEEWHRAQIRGDDIGPPPPVPYRQPMSGWKVAGMVLAGIFAVWALAVVAFLVLIMSGNFKLESNK